MSTTPNMGMLLPEVGVTLSPLWASELNTALDLVDSHNHAPGSGALIGAAGIRIDADLDFGSFNITGLRTARLSNQTSIVLGATDLRAIYSSGGDLYYVNAAGAAVQITNGSSIVGATGSISGLVSPASASFSSGTSTFAFFKDSSKPGKLTISDISIYEFNNAAAAPITIKSPTSVGASYSLTLPTALYAPATTFMAVSSTGALSLGAGGTLLVSDGSAAAPTMAFASQVNVGLYRDAPNELAISLVGTLTHSFKSTGMVSPSGSAVTPAYSFTGDSDTGIYSGGSGVVNISTNGSLGTSFDTVGIKTLNGSVSNPTYSFSTDTSTGMYRPSTGVLAFTASGTQGLIVRSTSVTVNSGPLTLPNGSFVTPGLSFSDATSGVYFSSGLLGFAIGSTSIGRVTSSGLSITGAVATGTLTTTTTAIIGSDLRVGSTLSFDGGFSTVRIKTFSGTLGVSPATASFSVGSPVYGAVGSYTNGAGSELPISMDSAGSNDVKFFGATSGSVSIQNTVGSTRAYRVTVFY